MTSRVQIGVTLPQFTDDRERLLDGARRAEAAGLDSVWLFDHLWPLSGGKERPLFEAWTALSYLTGVTERVTIGTLVTRSSLRNHALLGHMAASVAEMAPGRLVVAVGSGDELSRAENEAYGIPYREGTERIDDLEGATRVVRDALRGSGSRVWVAGRSDDAIDVAARLGDGWNGWDGGPEAYARDVATLTGLAGEHAVEPTWGGLVTLGRDDEDAAAKLRRPPQTGQIVGGPATVAGALLRFIDAGARHLVLTFTDPWRPGVYETLAGDVSARLT